MLVHCSYLIYFFYVFYRKVGKVLFTIEAKLWNGDNTYDEVRDIIAPITMISSAALSGARGLAAMASGHAAEEMKNRGQQTFSMGKVLIPEECPEETQKVIKVWITDCAVRGHGFFMGSDRIPSLWKVVRLLLYFTKKIFEKL